MSFVFANENITDDANVLSSDDTNTISIDDRNNEIISDSNSGNFTELSQQIQSGSGTINLDKDYKYAVGDDVPETGIVVPNQNARITINGNGHTIDGSNLVRFLQINSGYDVILKDLNIINCHSTGEGGAIYSTSAGLRISNCTFENNFAEESAGAIYVTKEIYLENSKFINNSANYGAGALEASGMRNLILNPYIKNSTFINNRATVYEYPADIMSMGGAICLYGSEESNSLKITECTFINNTATQGGAIYETGKGNYIADSKFINNNAFFGGGIYYNRITTGDPYKNLYFENNSAVFNGGGIYGYVAGKDFDNMTFINNYAAIGGGIFLIDGYTGSADDTNGRDTIRNSRFINNTALYGGAGADIVSNTTIINSTFISNHAQNYGGAIGSCNSQLINLTLINNTATFGGAIYTYNTKIENSTFEGNNASNGSAIYILDLSTLINNKNLDDTNVETYNSGEARGESTTSSYHQYLLKISDSPYYGYCVERFTVAPYQGVFDNRLALLRNAINHEPIGEYLKILLYTNLNCTQDLKDIPFYDYVWEFSDFEYWNSEDPIIKEVLRLYDSGFRVPTENAVKLLPNNTLVQYNFSSFITPSVQQNLFLFSFNSEDLLVPTLTKAAINKTVYLNDNVDFRITVTNDNNMTLNDIFIEDNDYSYGLEYISWRPETGSWTYNETTKRWKVDEILSNESASIILTFKVFAAGVLNNTAKSGNEKVILGAANGEVEVLNPNMTVEKNALNTKIKLGDEAIFEIIVNNTGNVELTNITIIEDKYDDGLVYLTFKSIEGTWEESLNNESKHVFTLTTPLKVGKTAKFQVIFNTTKIGEFKNTVIGNSEEEIEPITSTGVINVINNTAPDDSDNDTVPEDSDSKVKPDIIFAIENNGSNHNVDEVSHSEIVKVDDKATGNPLLVLILTLLALPIIRYKN